VILKTNTCAFALLFFVLCGARSFAQLYSVTDLGALPDSGATSVAYGINKAGTIVGQTAGASDAEYNACGFPAGGKPFIWTAATGMQVIGPPPLYTPPIGNVLQACGGVPFGINDQGLVVGTLDYGFAGGFHPFIWTAIGGMQLIPGNGTLGEATAVNNAGEVVGGQGGTAFRWTDTGGLEFLGVPAVFTFAAAVNNNGQVVGYAGFGGCAGGGPVIWNVAGQVQFVGLDTLIATLPPYDFLCGRPATGINDQGAIIGSLGVKLSSALSTGGFGWFFQNGIVTPLGEVPSNNTHDTVPNGINNQATVVGASNGRAFVWTSVDSIRDLNSLLDSSGTGWSLYAANAINDAGQIVGYGNHNGETRAFLLTPASASGTISVTTNLPAATFSITGPASYFGSGTTFTKPRATPGTYSITFWPVPGYSTPASQMLVLTAGGNISFTGTYQPFLSANPASVSFQYLPGTKGPIPSQMTSISTSAGSLPFTISLTTNPPGGTWVSVSPPSGTATAGGTNVSFTVLASMPPGSYFAAATISATGAANPLVNIPLALIVGAAPPPLPPSAMKATLTVTTNQSGNNASFTIFDRSGRPLPNAISITSFDEDVLPGSYSIFYNPLPGYYTPKYQQISLLKPGDKAFRRGVFRRLFVIGFTGWNDAPDQPNCFLGNSGSGVSYTIKTTSGLGVISLLNEIQQDPVLSVGATLGGFTYYSAGGDACKPSSDDDHVEAQNWIASQNVNMTDDMIAVVGHSYGGNRARMFVDQLRIGSLRLSTDLLVTLDPIDWNSCNLSDLITGVLGNPCDQSQLSLLHNANDALSYHQVIGEFGPFPKGYTLKPPSIVITAPDYHTTIDDDSSIHTQIMQTLRSRLGL